MRFLVGADYPPVPNSGAAGTVFQSIRGLREIGCEVDEIWRDDLGRRIRHGNLHYWLELPRAFRRAVAERCARKDYDVVLLSQPHAWLAGQYLHRHHPRTLFLNRSHGWEGAAEEVMEQLTARTGGAPEVSAPRRWLRRQMRARLARSQDRVVEQADGLVVGSALIADFLMERYGCPAGKIGIVPHGVHAGYLAAEPPPDRPERWRKILYVGQFTPIKGPEQVARVLNETLGRRPEASAGWVCDAVHHEAVRGLLAPEIRGRTTIYPWMDPDELQSVFDEHGLFLFPSWYEGCAKAPIEAMSRGLAVVSSRIGGPADRIRPGANGFLFAPGETAGMARQLEELLDDPDAARRIGRQARADVLGLTWANHARQVVAFAERLRAERSAAGAAGAGRRA